MRRPNEGSIIVEGSADRMGAMVISSCKNFVKGHKVISLIWVGGLLLSILATGYAPSPAAVRKYKGIMATLEHTELAHAEDEMIYWDQEYRRSKGMFWSCDENCTRKKMQYQSAKEVFDAVNRDYQRKLAKAKSQLGVFSQDGVAETRDLFWRKVAGGKQYAKRATMWDVVFVGVGSAYRRDEGIFSILVRIAFRLVINLTMGFFMAVVQFLFTLWRVIWSYQPDPISTIAFFCMAAVAAVSLLVTWFLGLAALGVTGVYAVAKATEMAQIEATRQGQQQPQYVQQQERQQQYDQYQSRPQYNGRQQQARQRRPPPYAPGSQPASQTRAYSQDASGFSWEHID